MKIKSKLYLLIILVSVGFFSCEKDNKITPPPPAAEFAVNSFVGKYFIKNDPNSVFKIPVGITNVSNEARTVNFTVTSPTGATQGQQFTLPGNSLVIPAGKSVDSISLQGIYAGYASRGIDTLVFQITSGDGLGAFSGYDTYKVILQKYCDVNINDFVGTYTQSFDDGSYGPYEIEVVSATATGSTSGYLMISNLWDANGPTPVRVNLDWSDPSNFSTSVAAGQNLYVDGTYGQAKVKPNGFGTFSSCNNTITLKYQVYVAAGSFAATTTTMAR